jgi:hypothetical protein
MHNQSANVETIPSVAYCPAGGNRGELNSTCASIPVAILNLLKDTGLLEIEIPAIGDVPMGQVVPVRKLEHAFARCSLIESLKCHWAAA